MDYVSRMFYERILQSEAERLAHYVTCWKYYDGDHTKPLKVKTGEPDDNVIINLSKLIVDKGVSFLFGKDVGFELAEGTETPEEEYLAKVWKRNRKMTLLSQVALNGGVTGHFFVKIMADGIEKGIPRLVNLDPAYVRPVWDPDDVDRVLWYKIEYAAVNVDGDSPIYKKQLITRMEDGDGVTRTWLLQWYEAIRGRKYELVREEEWDWPWPPIVDSQNLPAPNEYFGTSDLEDADLNDAVNFSASNILRILRYHAHPKTWGKGFKASQVEIGVNDMIILPSADAMVDNLEMESDLASSRQYMADLMGAFREVSRTPQLDPARVNIGALSGFALRILYGPLLEKTETKRRLYGDMLVELNRRLLDLGGFGDGHYTTLHWADPIPFDPREETDALKADRELGIVSQETMATKRGYDWSVEGARLESEGVQELAKLARVMGGGGGQAE